VRAKPITPEGSPGAEKVAALLKRAPPMLARAKYVPRIEAPPQREAQMRAIADAKRSREIEAEEKAHALDLSLQSVPSLPHTPAQAQQPAVPVTTPELGHTEKRPPPQKTGLEKLAEYREQFGSPRTPELVRSPPPMQKPDVEVMKPTGPGGIHAGGQGSYEHDPTELTKAGKNIPLHGAETISGIEQFPLALRGGAEDVAMYGVRAVDPPRHVERFPTPAPYGARMKTKRRQREAQIDLARQQGIYQERKRRKRIDLTDPLAVPERPLEIMDAGTETAGQKTGQTVPSAGARDDPGRVRGKGGGGPYDDRPSSSDTAAAGGGRRSGGFPGRGRRGGLRGSLRRALEKEAKKTYRRRGPEQRGHRQVTLQELASLLQPRTISTPHPVIVGATQPSGGSSSTAPEAKDSGKIEIKQTVKQIVGPRKRRKAKAGAGNKAELKSRKSEYAALKRQVRKRLAAERKAAYQKAATAFKKLPAKERKAKLAQLKKEYKDKLAGLVKQMPSAAKRKINDVIALLKRIKTLKW
jgi:hypothetical protein